MKAIIGAAAGLAMSATATFADDFNKSDYDATIGSADTCVVTRVGAWGFSTPIASIAECFDLADRQSAPEISNTRFGVTATALKDGIIEETINIRRGQVTPFEPD